MKKQTLGLLILVVIGILAIGLVVKYNKIIWGHNVCEKQGEIDLYGNDPDSGVLNFIPAERWQYYLEGVWDGTKSDSYEDAVAYNDTLQWDNTENYLFIAPDGDEITIDKVEWSLLTKDTLPFVFSGFPQVICDEIVYLGVETVVDTIRMTLEERQLDNGAVIFSDRKLVDKTYLNLHINGKKYRIAMEEIK